MIMNKVIYCGNRYTCIHHRIRSTKVTKNVLAHEMQLVDRELSLEHKESSVNPAFIRVLSPSLNSYNHFFFGNQRGATLEMASI